MLDIQALANLTDEEISLIGLTKEEYTRAKEDLIKRLEQYGDTIEIYDITILNEDDCARLGELTFQN